MSAGDRRWALSLPKCKAVFPYKARDEFELSANSGDIVHILATRDDGWVCAKNGDFCGLMPFNILSHPLSPKRSTSAGMMKSGISSRENVLKGYNSADGLPSLRAIASRKANIWKGNDSDDNSSEDGLVEVHIYYFSIPLKFIFLKQTRPSLVTRSWVASRKVGNTQSCVNEDNEGTFLPSYLVRKDGLHTKEISSPTYFSGMLESRGYTEQTLEEGGGHHRGSTSNTGGGASPNNHWFLINLR